MNVRKDLDPDIAHVLRVMGEAIEEIGLRELSEGRDLTDDELRAAAFLAQNVIAHVYGPAANAPEAFGPVHVASAAEVSAARHGLLRMLRGKDQPEGVL